MIMGSIDRDELRAELQVPTRYEILLVIALGKPKERVVLEEMTDDDVKYWRDADGKHHVPKRPLKDVILDAKK